MATKITLSNETLEALELAAKVNNSIKINRGNVIKSLAEGDEVAFYAVINDEFPETFGVYDLSQLLSILKQSTFKDAVLEFDDTGYVLIQAAGSSIRYWFHLTDFIKSADKVNDIQLPSVTAEFTFTEEQLQSLLKVAAILGHKQMVFKVENGKVFAIATTRGVDTANDFKIELGETDADDCELMFLIANLKLVKGDYTVQLSADIFQSKFTHKEKSIISYIGAERV